MCGITGFIDSQRSTSGPELEAAVGRMADVLQHRGPDDRGTWVDPEAGIALGHRRLSILDLSAAGHQPMLSQCERYVIVYNGEVYNFRSLEKELQSFGYHFRGHSDTEIILAAITHWGIEEALKRFIGMFALALWDRRERRLHLVRDRLGIKPLYYGWFGNTFAFGSELKAFRAHAEFDAQIDRDALALYARYQYIPAPYSIYQGIKKLTPGTVLTLNAARTPHTSNDPQPVPYWSAREAAERSVREPFSGSEVEAVEELDRLLRDAVKLRMEADVPLGAFLSGGIDSSTVVALMQAQSNRPIKTFSIGYSEDTYNEADDARAVAEHLNTDHTELQVTSAQAMAVIPSLPALYDEPFADSSQIPTFLVSQLARGHVTVSLSGDGGDELFCGYSRYITFRKIWNLFGWVPSLGRRVLGEALLAVPSTVFDRSCTWLTRNGHDSSPGDQLHKLAEVLLAERADQMYARLMSHASDPAAIIHSDGEPNAVLTKPGQTADVREFTEKMMFLDLVSYLPDDILTKVDRASMGVSLEARVPILDHRVAELAWRLPLDLKFRQGQSKWILRQVLHRYVPPALVDRPKQGFAVPIDVWLRGPLKEWAQDLLDERRLRQQGFFDERQVQGRLREHLSGRRKWHSRLWAVLMFESWLESQRSGLTLAKSEVAAETTAAQ